MNKHSVSILTISQLSRSECLKVLFDNIKQQSYKNIKEWIIIDGSKNMNEGNSNKILVNNLIASDKSINFEIKYIPYKPFKNLSQLKNIANNFATGDYIIWMDDDDYHMDGRIEYSVNKLVFNKKQIGGSLNLYVHDIDLGQTFKTNVSNTEKSTIYPNSLIYHRDYLTNNTYSDDIDYYFDELKFVINSASDFEVLIPETTFVKIIHKENTENKKHLTLQASDADAKNEKFIKLDSDIRKFLIPDNFYSRYIDILKTNEPVTNEPETNEPETNEPETNEPETNEPVPDTNYINYDIVYYTGVNGLTWDPEDKTLGGSEQAIVHLSENWVKQNKSVVVYGLFKEEKNVNGVEYKLSNNFPINKKSKVLVLWRSLAIAVFLDVEPLADKIILDLHDNFSYTLAYFDRPKLLKFLEKVTKINFKSEYHKICFEEFIQSKMVDSDYNIIPNGIRIKLFQNNKCLNDDENIIRNPYRFCYCSSYDRGLESILIYLWAQIYKLEPRAELHVYYGMDYIYNTNFKTNLQQLLSQPGVMDHGRQSVDMVIREKYLSTFHLYFSNSSAEIDCISIKESLVTGCIPIISKSGVFIERDGLQYNCELTNMEVGKQIAENIFNKMHDSQFITTARQNLSNSYTIIDWSDVAKTWLNTF
jgi:glycosyltransferase involved in cell wall biosynthesis